MEANVSSVTAGMQIFAKYNSQARVEFWDGYMVVFVSDIGKMSEADELYLRRLGWKLEDDAAGNIHIPALPVWEYGL